MKKKAEESWEASLGACVRPDGTLFRVWAPEAEAVYAVRQEMACSVADVLDRRTRASLRDARGAAAAAARVAALIGPELGWDDAVDHCPEAYERGRRCAIKVSPGRGRCGRRPPCGHSTR